MSGNFCFVHLQKCLVMCTCYWVQIGPLSGKTNLNLTEFLTCKKRIEWRTRNARSFRAVSSGIPGPNSFGSPGVMFGCPAPKVDDPVKALLFKLQFLEEQELPKQQLPYFEGSNLKKESLSKVAAF